MRRGRMTTKVPVMIPAYSVVSAHSQKNDKTSLTILISMIVSYRIMSFLSFSFSLYNLNTYPNPHWPLPFPSHPIPSDFLPLIT